MFISLEQLNSTNMVASNWTGIDSVVYYFCCWRCLFSPFYYLFIFILDVYYLFKAKQTSILCYSFLLLLILLRWHHRWSPTMLIIVILRIFFRYLFLLCAWTHHSDSILFLSYFSFSWSIWAYSVVKCVVWMSSIQLFRCLRRGLGFMTRVSWPSPRKTDEKKIE